MRASMPLAGTENGVLLRSRAPAMTVLPLAANWRANCAPALRQVTAPVEHSAVQSSTPTH